MESKLERGTLLRNLSTRETGLMVVGAQQLSPLWHMFIIVYQLRWNESEFDESLCLFRVGGISIVPRTNSLSLSFVS